MSHNGNGRHCFSFEGYRLYPDERLLVRDGRRVALTPRVLDLLLVLVNHSGELVSKERLLASVWSDSFVEEGNINRTVSTLRKSLGSQANGSDFIETVPKIGYRFIALVEETIEPRRKPGRPILLVGAVAGVLGLILFASSSVTGPRTETQEVRAYTPVAETPSNEPVRLTSDAGEFSYPTWTDDGRIRFLKDKDGEPHIMDASGMNDTRVEDIPGLEKGNWSPDGKRVFFWKHNDPNIYLADATGASEKKLPFHGGNLAWSADGKSIVYVSVTTRGKNSDWEIFTYELATGTKVNVTNNAAFDADPAFSPDGTEIVFNSNRDGNFEIYLMNVDGSNVRRLTNHPAWDSHPAFAPDGTQIVFNSNRENENYDLYLMNTEGEGFTKLTNWESNESVEPGCWSPDGTKIALVSDRSGKSDIYVMTVEPFRPRLLLNDGDASIGAAVYSPDGKEIAYQAELPDKSGELRIHDIQAGHSRTLLSTVNSFLLPSWSTDGKRIIFQNKVDGQTDLFLVEHDSGRVINLTNAPTTDASATWSPDGSKIVFVADSYGQQHLFSIDTATGERHRLTDREGTELDPIWSPDGSKIAFACDRADVPGYGLNICLVEHDGNGEKRLSIRRGHESQPAWSPDGSRLLFVANSDGNPEIYLIDADGTGLLRLTRNAAADVMPRWSPDGRSVIFTSDRNGKSSIYEIAL